MRVYILLIFFSLLNFEVSKASVRQKINPGDTVFDILRRHKFQTEHLNQALSSDSRISSFDLIPGQHYFIVNSPESYKVQFYDYKSEDRFVFWRSGRHAGLDIEKPTYRTTVESFHGKVHGSLIASISNKIPDKQIAYRFMDAFSYDYNLQKVLQRGARFALTVEKKYDGKEFIKYGEILTAQIEINGQLVTRFFVSFPDGGAFISTDWNQSQRPLYSPAAYSRFSSHFSQRRKHPIQGRVKPHLGLDFELPLGASIYSVGNGKVLRMGRNRAAGNFVVISHRNGFESYYNHLQALSPTLKIGDFVAPGQILGTNGCTGYCTKPHLHFALKKQGKFVDPIKYVKSYPYHRKDSIKKELASR